MIHDATPPGAFEIEVGTLARFLELLRRREDERVPSEHETVPRRAVFVAPVREGHDPGTGVPFVTRRVRAAFAYGADLVTLTRKTTEDHEFPGTPEVRENRAKNEEAAAEAKEQIVVALKQLGVDLPVVEAWMKLPGSRVEPGKDR